MWITVIQICLLIINAYFYPLSAETNGLKLTDVHIPRYMDLHQAATLSCNFDLGEGKLYSIKWYKDENEFFRYMPDNKPAQIQTFPVHGVNLDLSQSNMTVITLTPLNFNSSGSYRCEVSTDGPNFETVVQNGNMTVMVFPNDDPKIDGIHTWYNVGDYIIGNCTSVRSNPAAELSWFINQNKVDSWKLRKYPVMTAEEYLYVQTLGVHIQVEKTHFGNNSRLELRCTAQIADLPEWHRTITIYPAYSRLTNEKPAPDRYQNNFGAVNFRLSFKILCTCTIAIISRYCLLT